MQQRSYQSPGIQPDLLAMALCQWFQEHDYETRFFCTEAKHLVIQGYRADLWRSVLGNAVALTVEVKILGSDKITVEVKAGAWVDKWVVAGVGVLSLFLLPLLFTAAWGAWQQSQLDRRIWDVIESNLPTTAERVIFYPAPMTEATALSLPTDWFDPATGEIYSTRFFEQMTSWQQAMADGIIEFSEIEQQNSLVVTLMQDLEITLDDEVHASLGEVFGELAVLQGMQSAALVKILTESPP